MIPDDRTRCKRIWVIGIKPEFMNIAWGGDVRRVLLYRYLVDPANIVAIFIRGVGAAKIDNSSTVLGKWRDGYRSRNIEQHSGGNRFCRIKSGSVFIRPVHMPEKFAGSILMTVFADWLFARRMSWLPSGARLPVRPRSAVRIVPLYSGGIGH